MKAFRDVLPQLHSLGLDNHEATEALRSALSASGSRPSGKRIYDLLKGEQIVAQALFTKKGILKRLCVDQSLWQQVEAAIVKDAQRDILRVARPVLLAYRQLTGSYTVPGWLQIRPVGVPLVDRTSHRALSSSFASAVPFPFAVEVTYRWSRLPFLEAHRRLTAIQHASWLLSTFIDIPVFSLSIPYSWAFLDSSYALVQCGVSHGLENAPEDAYSEPSGTPQLHPVPSPEYYAALGIGSSDFRVPDLAYLYARFTALSTEKRLRFLRCCASIFAASSPATGQPQKLVALVSAIEPLLEETQTCKVCHSHVGISAAFRSFLDEYVHPTPEVSHLYEAVYASRSSIVHGGWNPDVDEPFLSLSQSSYLEGLAAWAAAKQGAVNWLLAQKSGMRGQT